MRVGRFLVLAVMIPSFLAGCGTGRDVDIQVHVSGVETQVGAATPEASARPESTPSQAEPTSASTSVGPTVQETEPSSSPEQSPAAEGVSTEPPAAPTAGPTVAQSPASPTQGPQAKADAYSFDPADWEQSVATLATFRQKVVLDFIADGTDAQSKLTYEGEVTNEPMALHLILYVEGQVTAQLPSNRVEVIWVGDQAWIKVGRKPWIQVSTAALESEYAGQVVGIGDLLPLIQQAQRAVPDETVNGIPCKHYVYDVGNLQTESGMTSAQGDIWVAKEGGYIVRLTLNGQGTYYGTYDSGGTVNLVYDLYDVNAAIDINPPR